MSKIVYLDMDGVLVDFDNHFKKIIGESYKTNDKKLRAKNLESFIKARGFATAPVLKNGWNLYNLLKNSAKGNYHLKILTSGANLEGALRKDVYEQKTEWLARNAFVFHPDQFILSENWKDKASYANPDTFLIDDTERNCVEFKKAGGSVLLWNDAKPENPFFYIPEMFCRI